MTAPDAATAAGARTALLPLAMLVTLGTIWGLSFSLAKIATTEGVHPFGLMLWQSGGAVAIVFAFCLVRRRLRRLRLAHLRYYVVCGMTGIIVPSGAIYWAAPHVPAGVMAILITTATILTYALALAMRLERFHWMRVSGIALGFAAVLLIVGPSASLPDRSMAGWALLGMVAPLCYAVNTVYVARFRPAATDSFALALGMLTSALVVIAPVALLSGMAYLPGPPWDRVDVAVLGLPAITGVAMLIMFELIRIAGAVFFAQVGYLITAGGVLWGMVLFDERHSPLIWAALTLMLAGLALVNARRAGAAQTPQPRRTP